jgi:hypothetical protein
MSDAKAKRLARDSARGEAAAEPVAAAAEPTAEATAAPAVNERPADAAETLALAAATAPPRQPVLGAEPAPGKSAPAAADDAWTALAAAQSALARACEEMAVEVCGITRSGIAASTDAALALLGARTFAEAVEINAGLAQRGFDAIVEGSAKLSEIGVKAMTEASRPLITRLSAGWDAAGR